MKNKTIHMEKTYLKLLKKLSNLKSIRETYHFVSGSNRETVKSSQGSKTMKQVALISLILLIQNYQTNLEIQRFQCNLSKRCLPMRYQELQM